MSEEEWFSAEGPTPMTALLEANGILSERKSRLFAIVCCLRISRWMKDERSRAAILICEQCADGLLGQRRLNTARRAAYLASKSLIATAEGSYPPAFEHAAIVALHACSSIKKHTPRIIADATSGCASSLLAHVEGDASGATETKAQASILREIFGNPFHPVPLEPRWLTSTVADLARTIYDERAFDRLPILSDALMDAGCDSDDIIQHCRGDGPHVRGCWVVDLLLGKE